MVAPCFVGNFLDVDGRFTYIWLIFVSFVNIGIHTIHGWYGYVDFFGIYFFRMEATKC